MNSKSKYRRFNAKFTKKVIQRPVKVNNIMSQMQMDLVSMKLKEKRTDTYIVPLMDIFCRFHLLAPLQGKLSSQEASNFCVERVSPERLQSGKCWRV